jgi:hypothetical protein
LRRHATRSDVLSARMLDVIEHPAQDWRQLDEGIDRLAAEGGDDDQPLRGLPRTTDLHSVPHVDE